MYYCEGGNFHKILGKEVNQTIIKYQSWKLPRYMRIGIPYVSKFKVISNRGEHLAYVTLEFDKVNINGRKCVMEVFYDLRGSHFVYYFDPVTYRRCK